MPKGYCDSQVSLKGKTVIVTGANTGIGYETAIDLAKRGARLIMGCRSEGKAVEARDKIINATHNQDVHVKLVDFASLASVRNFAADIIANEDRLDILINNAGLEIAGISEDGLSLMMQINHFGPVLLTQLLLDMLKKTKGRIVNVSSVTAKAVSLSVGDMKNLSKEVGGKVRMYARSKLCNILYTIELAKHLKGTGVTVYSLHPGIVKTDFFRNAGSCMNIFTHVVFTFAKDATEGAQTSIYCAVEDGIEKDTGKHFEDCKLVSPYKSARDPAVAKALWDETMKILQLEY